MWNETFVRKPALCASVCCSCLCVCKMPFDRKTSLRNLPLCRTRQSGMLNQCTAQRTNKHCMGQSTAAYLCCVCTDIISVKNHQMAAHTCPSLSSGYRSTTCRNWSVVGPEASSTPRLKTPSQSRPITPLPLAPPLPCCRACCV